MAAASNYILLCMCLYRTEYMNYKYYFLLLITDSGSDDVALIVQCLEKMVKKRRQVCDEIQYN